MDDRVFIFDTTLREGEETPGCGLNPYEKLEVARQLARLGVDVIEAGIPVASTSDFEAVHAIAGEVEGPIICGLAHAREKDIIRCGEAIKIAPRSRIHVFIAPSDVAVEKKLRLSKERVIQMAGDAIRLARTITSDVEFSPQNGGRIDFTYFCEILAAAIEAGATTVNFSDTLGYFTPNQFSDYIDRVKKQIPQIDNCILSVHCHNDLGLAVACSLAGVEHGARQIECTVNGLGQRGGNTSLDEVVMNLMLRPDYYGVKTGINTHEIYRTSRLVSHITGVAVERNRPIVGADAFSEEELEEAAQGKSPPHQLLTPEIVGWTSESVILGKHSRRSAFRARLAEMGFSELHDEEVDRIYDGYRRLADRKETVYDEDIAALVEEEMAHALEHYRLDYCHISSGTSMIPSATVRVRKGDDTWLRSSTGDGPIDAIYKALSKALGIDPKLEQYQNEAVTAGGDALGRVNIRMIIDDISVRGTSTSTDLALASAKAYLNAVNRYEVLKNLRMQTQTMALKGP